MGWNIVMTLTNYKSGTYPVKAYADSKLCVGDKARIQVLGGYETDCEIIDIISCNVKPTDKHGRVTINKPKEDYCMFGAKTVEIHGKAGKSGIFFTDLELKVGQTVVYESDGDMLVGIVTNEDPDKVTAQSWVVDVVDLSAHEDRLKRVKEARKLKAKLDAKRKQFQDIELLRLIAANDPETKEMLDQYTSLIRGE